MTNDPTRDLADQNIQSILEWLALAHGRTGADEAIGLQRQLLLLRNTPVATTQRIKLLDLLYGHAVKITLAQLPLLHDLNLPVARKIRQLVRCIQELLEILVQDYLNTLSELYDPLAETKPRSPQNTLRRIMQCLSWHLMISHLVAAPTGTGIWALLHSTYATSRRLGLAAMEAPGDGRRIEQIYLSSLLIAIAQPASFNSRELEFITQYINDCATMPDLTEQAPIGRHGIFWIDPEKDSPAHALSRRIPPPDALIFYLTCDTVAQNAADHLAAIESGQTAAELGLPALADTASGQGVLRRLADFWGNPVKRKFPRRRQSYRADLCAGLERLWHLLRGPDHPRPPTSEWMVTNESPDGYAMMHVAGKTEELRVGDIVAVHPLEGHAPDNGPWHICIVRWALSENPEHVELGLQVLAPRGFPALLALPDGIDNLNRTSAILLPETPPLRPLQALIVPSGTVTDRTQKLILLMEQDNLKVREMRAKELDEQTSSIEVFTVEPDQSL